uniref:Uncharacterized protein n=1 Tax=Anguilla anguilla TaxID=7936 RepID=A0A0E9VI06_ANGAN
MNICDFLSLLHTEMKYAAIYRNERYLSGYYFATLQNMWTNIQIAETLDRYIKNKLL